MDLSKGEESYLKRTLEAFEDDPSAIVKTSDLAKRLEVNPASVTEMIKKLAGRNLITHIPYRGSRLTSEGFDLANKVKRRQLLIEILFSDVAGLKTDVTSLAAKIEHHMDEESEKALDAALGYPLETLDGRKIPDIGRQIIEGGVARKLIEMSDGMTGKIGSIKLKDHNLDEFSAIGIQLGEIIERTLEGAKIGEVNHKLSTSMMESIIVKAVD